MKRFYILMYGMATVCCAILCVLALIMQRPDLFILFLLMFVVLTAGYVGDEIIRRKHS